MIDHTSRRPRRVFNACLKEDEELASLVRERKRGKWSDEEKEHLIKLDAHPRSRPPPAPPPSTPPPPSLPPTVPSRSASLPKADLLPGGALETYGPGLAIEPLSGADTSVIDIYERLPARRPTGLRFAAADEARLRRPLGRVSRLSDKLTVQDTDDARMRSGAGNSRGGRRRTHPELGAYRARGRRRAKVHAEHRGGVQQRDVDIVVLANELARAVAASSAKGEQEPLIEAINAAFAAYQGPAVRGRGGGVQGGAGKATATATATWKNGVFRWVDCRSWGARGRKSSLWRGRRGDCEYAGVGICGGSRVAGGEGSLGDGQGLVGGYFLLAGECGGFEILEIAAWVATFWERRYLGKDYR